MWTVLVYLGMESSGTGEARFAQSPLCGHSFRVGATLYRVKTAISFPFIHNRLGIAKYPLSASQKNCSKLDTNMGGNNEDCFLSFQEK